MVREIIAYKGNYSEFMKSIPEQHRMKIMRALLLFSNNDRIPAHYITYLRDDIFEFRITCIHIEYRILFCYDGNTMVILFNCFKKKTQKTPKKEIDKAIKLRHEYYEDKLGQNL